MLPKCKVAIFKLAQLQISKFLSDHYCYSNTHWFFQGQVPTNHRSLRFCYLTFFGCQAAIHLWLNLSLHYKLHPSITCTRIAYQIEIWFKIQAAYILLVSIHWVNLDVHIDRINQVRWYTNFRLSHFYKTHALADQISLWKFLTSIELSLLLSSGS